LALSSTIYTAEIDLADHNRHVYESLSLKLAQHPSESPEYFVTRLLAYCLEYAEGIQFSRGVSEPDEPTVSIRDLTGVIRVWIEIGTPDAARLHKASKAASRVVVYCHKDIGQWRKQLAGEKIHRADAIEIYTIGRETIAALAGTLDRRIGWTMSIVDDEIHVACGTATIEGVRTRTVI
jgi:uncharacterized protein YaeQ